MALHHHAVFKMESSVKTHGRRQTGVASPEISMVSCLRYYVVSSLLSNLGVMEGGKGAATRRLCGRKRGSSNIFII